MSGTPNLGIFCGLRQFLVPVKLVDRTLVSHQIVESTPGRGIHRDCHTLTVASIVEERNANTS